MYPKVWKGVSARGDAFPKSKAFLVGNDFGLEMPFNTSKAVTTDQTAFSNRNDQLVHIKHQAFGYCSVL